MKRSYRTGKNDSMSVVGAIIGYHTQKVLFAGVKNKMCVICHNAARKNEKPKKHSCFKNWGRHQTSTKMESDAIADGFETSIKKRGLVYATLIADGDSSVYKKILDCDPYKAEMVRVKKIECTNHLPRNFCNKLKDIAKTTPPGKYRKAVESSVRRMRTDITKAAEYRVKDNVPINRKINNLQEDLTNIPSHVFGEHKECRRLGYFCDRIANNDEENMVPHLMEIGIYYKIQDIFRPLIAHAESLLYNSNNNSVESFNSIIAKYTGGKRINWSQRGSYTARCAAAVIQYNTKEVLSRIMRAKRKEPPKCLEAMEKRSKEENEKRNKKRKCSSQKARKPFSQTTRDKDYGPSAEKPDMEDHVFNLEKERHMEILQDWQNNRKKIEKESREQAKSQKWQMYRSKLLTASNFGKVCRRLKKTPCGNLVKSLLYPKVLDLPSIEHGRQCEDIAQEELSRKEGITIRKCGLFIDASIPFLGASPDGVIDDDDGIVEIKCPKTAENISPEEAIKTVPAVRKIFVDDAGTAMNKNNCYFYQVQGQLHITQKKYCLFCVWTRKGLISLKIYRDDKFWQQEMQSKLSRFYIHCMLPEIVDSRHNMSMAIREPSDIERRKPIIISSRSLESLELPDAMSSGSTL
ncbi:uncharacterized protein LOC143361003 [Halictus rubicundus]|uniref:uncharacterized protein LOC143361003 n=1 Tax=Halictus rubicundus TaxID=77578 RepID=UPI004037107B